MIISKLDDYLYIRPEKKNINELYQYLLSIKIMTYSIIDLEKINIKADGVIHILSKINDLLNSKNKSCVFIKKLSIDDIDSFNLVFLPTIKEGKDYLSMDEIERDLKNP